MRLFQKTKDGGPESPVDAYFLCEFKSLFSIALLKFKEGKREAFHNHAFNACTWLLKGDMIEEESDGETTKYKFSIIPKITTRSKLHRVKALTDSWCFTIRGPWKKTWKEYDEKTDETTVLTHGRKVVSVAKQNHNTAYV